MHFTLDISDIVDQAQQVAERNQLAYADEAPAALEAKTNEVPQKKADEEARVTTANGVVLVLDEDGDARFEE